jgi:hypothetical protein
MRLALEEAKFGNISFERVTKTISNDHLADQLRSVTPALRHSMHPPGRCLPARTRQKYRQVNIGEFMALAKPADK